MTQPQANFDVQFNAAAGNAAAPARVSLSGWKRFFADGLIWLLIALAARGVWSAGAYAARQARRVLLLIEWAENLPFGGDGRFPPFFDRRGKGRGTLEAWIAAKMPRDDRDGARAAASALHGAADLLRAGDLTGRRDAMAEVASRLTPALDRARWYSFLAELSDRLTDELDGTAGPGETADLFDRAADAIAGRAGAMEGSGGAEPPALKAEEGDGVAEAAPKAEAAPGRACSGGSCAAGYGYRYFF